MRGEIETLEERIVYQNDYATVWDDRVRFPDGHEGSYFRWSWNAPHGVGILPVFDGKVLLIRAFRYQERGFIVEMPQGFGEPGQTPEDDARRELHEETGLRAVSLEPLIKLGDNIVTHVFVAQVEPGVERRTNLAESTESIIDFVECPIAEISPAYLSTIGITGASTMAALLALRLVTEQ